MFDYDKLEKLSTRYEASLLFKKGKKIFFYYKSLNFEDNSYKYYLFNNELSFTKNFQILIDKFKNTNGFWSLYSNNENYPIKTTGISQTQLELDLFSKCN